MDNMVGCNEGDRDCYIRRGGAVTRLRRGDLERNDAPRRPNYICKTLMNPLSWLNGLEVRYLLWARDW